MSDEKSAVQDNPICYFPKQLSGNPLKKLRTSRFTCGPYRSSELIQDACQGIPVKTPVQQPLAVGLSSGTYMIMHSLEYQIIVGYQISAWRLTIFLVYYIKLQDFSDFWPIFTSK